MKKKCVYVFSKSIVLMHNCCTRVSQIFIQKQEERNLNNNLLAAIIYFFSVTRKLPEKYYCVKLKQQVSIAADSFQVKIY